MNHRGLTWPPADSPSYLGMNIADRGDLDRLSLAGLNRGGHGLTENEHGSGDGQWSWIGSTMPSGRAWTLDIFLLEIEVR